MSSFIPLEWLEILREDEMFCVTAPSGGSLLLRGFVFCCVCEGSQFFVVFFAYLKNLYVTNFKYAWNNFIVDIFYVLFLLLICLRTISSVII